MLFYKSVHEIVAKQNISTVMDCDSTTIKNCAVKISERFET